MATGRARSTSHCGKGSGPTDVCGYKPGVDRNSRVVVGQGLFQAPRVVCCFAPADVRHGGHGAASVDLDRVVVALVRLAVPAHASEQLALFQARPCRVRIRSDGSAVRSGRPVAAIQDGEFIVP